MLFPILGESFGLKGIESYYREAELLSMLGRTF